MSARVIFFLVLTHNVIGALKAQYKYHNVDVPIETSSQLVSSTYYDDNYILLTKNSIDQFEIHRIDQLGQVTQSFNFDTGLDNPQIKELLTIGDSLYTIVENQIFQDSFVVNIIVQNLINGEIEVTKIERFAYGDFGLSKINDDLLLSYLNNNARVELEILNKSNYAIEQSVVLPTEYIETLSSFGIIVDQLDNGINVRFEFMDTRVNNYSFGLDDNLDITCNYLSEEVGWASCNYDRRQLSYYNEEISYQSDDCVKSINFENCQDSDTETLFEDYNYGSIHQLDPDYFIGTKNNACYIYNCENILTDIVDVGVYSFIRGSQNLYKFSVENGTLRLHALSREPICYDSYVFTQQSEIDAFDSTCTRVFGDVIIDDGIDGEYDIDNLIGLTKLVEIQGNLRIVNTLLDSITELETLLLVKDTIEISNNINLSICSSSLLCNHISNSKESQIFNNQTGCNSIVEIIDNCNFLCPEGDVSITSYASATEYVAQYKYCPVISGNLSFGSFSSESAYIDFSFFENIKKVNGSVSFHNIETLDSQSIHLNIEQIDGSLHLNDYFDESLILDRLEGSIGSLDFLIQNAYSQMFDLGNITKVNGDILLHGVWTESLSYLSTIDSIGGSLSIQTVGVTSLEDLESLEHIGGNITIEYCPYLESCSIEEVCEKIINDSGIVTIANNLGRCQSKDSVVVYCNYDDLDDDGYDVFSDCDDNDSLVNPGMVEIAYNGKDDDCNEETLDDDLDQDGFVLENDCDDDDDQINPDAIEIPDNDIDEDCDGFDLTTTSIEEASNITDVLLHPNPVNNILNINNDKFESLEVLIFNTVGDIQFSQTIKLGNASLNVGHLSTGIYIVCMKSEEFIDNRILVVE